MMSTAMVAVILSACVMQEVSGTFLSRADSKDDVSCDQCFAAANKFLGSDCKEPRCLVQTFATNQNRFMVSAEERKKAFTAVQTFQDCAKKNQCDVTDGIAAAEEFRIKFDDLMSLLQEQVENKKSEDSQDEESEDSEREESEVSENEESEDSHGYVPPISSIPPLTGYRKDSPSRADSKKDDAVVSCDQCFAAANKFLGSDCKEARCLVQAFAAKQKDFMASADERKKAFTAVQTFQDCAKKAKCDLADGTAAAKEFNIEFDDLVNLLQVENKKSEDSQDEESEDSEGEESEVSENEESGDSHGSVAAEDSHDLSWPDSKDDVSCDQCLDAANKFLGSDCQEPRCLVQTFAAKQKGFLASAGERKKAFTAVKMFKDCADKNKCDIEDGLAAAEEFQINIDDFASL